MSRDQEGTATLTFSTLQHIQNNLPQFILDQNVLSIQYTIVICPDERQMLGILACQLDESSSSSGTDYDTACLKEQRLFTKKSDGIFLQPDSVTLKIERSFQGQV